MDLKQIDLQNLLDESIKLFPEERPTRNELKTLVTPAVLAAGLGIGEALALAAILLALWDRYKPKRDESVPLCRKMYNGKSCGQQFIRTEKDESFITLWCIRKHKTKLRIDGV